jgi:hypothetical protein
MESESRPIYNAIFTQFICHYFYSFNISSETHAIFMYIYVSYLTQKMIKNAIVFW